MFFEFRITVLSDATGGVPFPRHGAETYAFLEEKHRFPGHAMMGTRKRNTSRRCRRVVVKGYVGFRTIVLNEGDACSAKCSTDCVFPMFLSVADGMGFVDKRDSDSQSIFLNDATVGVPLPRPHHRKARKPMHFLRESKGFRAMR